MESIEIFYTTEISKVPGMMHNCADFTAAPLVAESRVCCENAAAYMDQLDFSETIIISYFETKDTTKEENSHS